MSDNTLPVPVPAPADRLDQIAQLAQQMLAGFRTSVERGRTGQTAEAVAGFEATLHMIATFREAATDLATNAPPADDPRIPAINEAIEFVNTGEALTFAFYRYYQATLMLVSAEFGNAADAYKEAARLFTGMADAQDPAMHCLARLAEAQSLQAESQKFTRDGNNSAGQERLSAAIALIHAEIEPHLGQLDADVAGAILVILASMKITVSTKAMLQDVIAEEYGSALLYAERIHEDVGKTRELAQSIGLPPELTVKLSRMMGTLALGVSGLEALALAGKASEDQTWETFERQANIAKMRFVEAQQACLENRETAVFSAQWTQLIEILVEPTRRHGRRLRELHAKIDEWKESYRSLAGKAGTQIAVSSTAQASAEADAEARAKAEQRVTVNTTIANFFEERTRDALFGLRAMLAMAPADNPERNELLKRIAEVTAVPKEDPTWLDKVKGFAAGAADIVGNVVKVAGPVASAWNMFAPLVGLPPLPIPG